MPGENADLHALLGLDHTFAPEFMLFRHQRPVDDAWEPCGPNDEGHTADSGVHRFDRVVGFALDAAEQRLLATDALAARAARIARLGLRRTSHGETVYRWSLFERFILKFHPESEYADYIRMLRRLSADEEEAALDPEEIEVHFQPPPTLLLISYATMLRQAHVSGEGEEVRVRKGSYIKNLVLNCVSSVCNEFGWHGQKPTSQARLIALLDSYSERVQQAVPFDMAEDLPKLFAAVWRVTGWSLLKKLQVYSQLLYSIVFMQRASDATLHCAGLDDMELPPVSKKRGGGSWRCSLPQVSLSLAGPRLGQRRPPQVHQLLHARLEGPVQAGRGQGQAPLQDEAPQELLGPHLLPGLVAAGLHPHERAHHRASLPGA